MTRLGIVIALLVALGVAESPGVRAQSGTGASTTAAVEVTVWRSIADPSLLYVSTRPEGGRWRTLNTSLDLSRRSASGRFYQSNAVRVAVPLARGATAAVEVTVWQRISDPAQLYVSTRPENGRWRTLNTPLDLSRRSASGRFHQSNAVRVTVPVLPAPSPDLVVDVPTVDATGPLAGQAFELAVTVRNQGTGAAAEATLIYYRSADATLTAGDTELGRDGVAALAAGSGRSEESLRTQAPATPGAYYYGACVAAVAGEADPTNNCSVGVRVSVAAFHLQQLPWVADGLTPTERRALDRIRSLARVDPALSQRVAGTPWLADGVTADELSMLATLESLADSHPALAAHLTTVPDRTGHLLGAVLRSVQVMLTNDPGRSEELQQRAWFRDGLTAEEGALIVVLGGATAACFNPNCATWSDEDFFQDLLRGGQVRSETIALPLAGAVDLYAVGRSSLALEGQLERMRFAAESMEVFLGTPWPQPATIVLVELESDLGADAAGWNSGDFAVVTVPTKDVMYHELGHFYFGISGCWTPFWLTEGAADFLMLHTLRLDGDDGSVDARYVEDQFWIAGGCGPQGWTNVQRLQEWMDTEGMQSTCAYLLGRQFLTGMYRTLGPAVVSAALREVFEAGWGTGRLTTEDAIYQAFLTHTPPAQRDTFRASYSCLHGRPIPGYTPPPHPAVAPESREALAALYHATNGPGWTNNANWLSDAPLDQWHGVLVDCNGAVTGLALFENQLHGPIPPELGNLPHLISLNLAGNQLHGPIPPELGGLGHLEELRLDVNQLTGQIPAELGRLAHLTELYLYDNQLSGPIPAALGNLAHLTELRLYDNRLSGSIPPILGGLTQLQSLGLANNQLSGPIPVALGNLAHLEELWLSNNPLTGQIPAELGNLAHLEELWLRNNRLTGQIPAELGHLAHLEELWLDINQLTGQIPAELGHLAHLEELGLDVNQLAGQIPAELGRLANLRELYLYDNQLHGPIPAALGNLAHLEELWLRNNLLTGQIPAELGNLAHLEELGLGINQLTGQIPAELGRLANLRELYLYDNQLHGPILPALGNLAHLEELWLRNNLLTGQILAELGRLANLTTLYLGGNPLTGCVPHDLLAVENTDIDFLGLAICEDS